MSVSAAADSHDVEPQAVGGRWTVTWRGSEPAAEASRDRVRVVVFFGAAPSESPPESRLEELLDEGAQVDAEDPGTGPLPDVLGYVARGLLEWRAESESWGQPNSFCALVFVDSIDAPAFAHVGGDEPSLTCDGQPLPPLWRTFRGEGGGTARAFSLRTGRAEQFTLVWTSAPNSTGRGAVRVDASWTRAESVEEEEDDVPRSARERGSSRAVPAEEVSRPAHPPTPSLRREDTAHRVPPPSAPRLDRPAEAPAHRPLAVSPPDLDTAGVPAYPPISPLDLDAADAPADPLLVSLPPDLDTAADATNPTPREFGHTEASAHPAPPRDLSPDDAPAHPELTPGPRPDDGASGSSADLALPISWPDLGPAEAPARPAPATTRPFSGPAEAPPRPAPAAARPSPGALAHPKPPVSRPAPGPAKDRGHAKPPVSRPAPGPIKAPAHPKPLVAPLRLRQTPDAVPDTPSPPPAKLSPEVQPAVAKPPARAGAMSGTVHRASPGADLPSSRSVGARPDSSRSAGGSAPPRSASGPARSTPAAHAPQTADASPRSTPGAGGVRSPDSRVGQPGRAATIRLAPFAGKASSVAQTAVATLTSLSLRGSRAIASWVSSLNISYPVAIGAIASVFVVALFVLGLMIGRTANVGSPVWTSLSPSQRAFRAIGMGTRPYVCSLASEPPRVQVGVDGRTLPILTPVALELLPGRHIITLELSGHGSKKLVVTGKSGDRVPLTVSLSGSVLVTLGKRAGEVQVTMDDQSFGPAPLRIDKVAPGPHQVAFSAPGHTPWERTVDVKVGEVTEISAQPFTTPATGTLVVRSTLQGEAGDETVHGARVWVDGRVRGRTPLKLELPRGPHSVRADYDGETSAVQVVDLPGANERFVNVVFGVDSEAPHLALDVSRGTRAEGTRISAVLDGFRTTEVISMWLHVRKRDQLWTRAAMTVVPTPRGVKGVVDVPATSAVMGPSAVYYVSALTTTGEEYYTEIRGLEPRASVAPSRTSTLIP